MPGVTWWKLTNSIMVRRAGRKPTFARPAASVSLGSKPTFAARCTNDRCQLRVGFHTLPQTTRIADPPDHGCPIRLPCRDVVNRPERQQSMAEDLGLGAESAMDIGHIDLGRRRNIAQACVGIGHPGEKQHGRIQDALFPACRLDGRAGDIAGWGHISGHGRVCFVRIVLRKATGDCSWRGRRTSGRLRTGSGI